MRIIALILCLLPALANAQYLTDADPAWWPRSVTASVVQYPFYFSTSNLISFSKNVSTTTGASIAQTTNGYVEFDSVLAANRTYSVFGTNVAAIEVEAVLNLITNYDLASPDNDHGGIGVRFSSGNDFGGWVGIDTLTSNLHIIDRIGGSESRSNIFINEGLFTNVNYRVCIANTNGDEVTLNLFNQDTGSQLLTNWTYTMLAGTPDTGPQFAHTFACRMKISAVTNRYAGFVWGANSPQIWTHGIGDSGLLVGGKTAVLGALTLRSDGTYNSRNSWTIDLAPIAAQNGSITGYLTRTSGRICGVAFRFNATNATGYAIYYDNNNTDLRLARDFSSPVVLKDSGAVTLTAGTQYPFTFTFNSTNLEFTINGFTWSTNDTTYTDSGYMGVMGFQSQSVFSNLVFTP